jgi:serine/threonine protein kinase
MALAAHLDEYGPDAIKILDKKDIKANELTVNVRREIAIMKALNHKNIVNLREVLSSKSKLYIVMDLVRGGELFEMINRKGELDEKLARSYFEQLVDGIDYCHRRGVLHRDLKPENLLVDEKGTLMITEFGVSSMKGGVAGSDILYTACGTPYYCALEIFNGAEEGYKGVKIDAWSCGIILYLLLTGSLPFINEDITHLYDQINRCIVNYPNWMSPDAIDLVSHLLRKDPNLRYSLDDLTRHPWFLVNYESADSEAEISPSGVGGPLPTKTSGKSSSTGFGSGEKFTGLVDVGVRFFVKENEHPGRREGMSSPVTAQTTSHGGSSQSSVPTPVDSSPVMKNNDTDIAVLYGDRPLSDLVKDALPGKPQKKINDVVARLEEIYVDCFDDVQLLTKTLGFLERLTAWLEDQSKLPSVTCMRLSKFFFAP